MIIQVGRNYIMLKRDIKNTFKNVPIAPYQQCLLRFIWKEEYYKEIGLLFGLSTIPFIFNLFGKNLQ